MVKMKKIITNITLASSVLFFSGCDVLQEVGEAVLAESGSTGATNTPSLSNATVIDGLKEALTLGIQNSVSLTSVTDGFLGNNEIKLPFPQDALKMKEKAEEWGLGGQVDKIVTNLNRAAEDASTEAKPIFIKAIKEMSIGDGFAILNGGKGAATQYLREKTTSQLVAAFSPKVQNSIEKVKLTSFWEPVATKYNQAMTFTGGDKVTTDLNAYVTERAVVGLFTMVEKEENKIRENPAARVTDLLQTVFGSITGQ